MAASRGAGIVAVAFYLAWLTSTAQAHHAFAAEFDVAKRVEFSGTISRVQWINPHALLFLVVDKSDGSKEEWEIELGTPGTLIQRGTTREMLAPGVWLRFTGYLARDGSRRASARTLRLRDGRSPFHSDMMLALMVLLGGIVLAVVVRFVLYGLLRLWVLRGRSAGTLLMRVPVIVQWVVIVLGALLALTGGRDVRG